MSQKNRMFNLTETQRAKIQAHWELEKVKKQMQSEPQYLNEVHKKSEKAKGRYLASLDPSEIDWEKEKERQIINARND